MITNRDHIVNYFELSDQSSESETSSEEESIDKQFQNNQVAKQESKELKQVDKLEPVIKGEAESSEEEEEEEDSDEESDTDDSSIKNNLVPVRIVQVTGGGQANQRTLQQQHNVCKPLNVAANPTSKQQQQQPTDPTVKHNQINGNQLTKSQSNFNLTNNLRRHLIQLKKQDRVSSEDVSDAESSGSSFNPLRHNYFLLKNLNECNLGKSHSQTNVRNSSSLNREDVVRAKYTAATKHSTQPNRIDHQNVNCAPISPQSNQPHNKPLKSILVINNKLNVNEPKRERNPLGNSKLDTKLNTKLNTKFNTKLTTQLNTQLNTHQLNAQHQLNARSVNRLSNNLNNKLNSPIKSNQPRSPIIENQRLLNQNCVNNRPASPQLNPKIGEQQRTTHPNGKMTAKLAASNEDYMNNNTNLVNLNNESPNVIKNPLSNKQLAQFDSPNAKPQPLNQQPTNVNNENLNNLKNENNPNAAQSPVVQQEDLLQPGHVVKGKLF